MADIPGQVPQEISEALREEIDGLTSTDRAAVLLAAAR